MNVFIKKIKEKITISHEEELFLQEIIKEKHYKRNTFFIKPTQVCSKIGFVENGAFRVFNIDVHGTEMTNWLIIDNDIITEIFSFIKQTPSQEYIQSLEDTTIYYITFNDLEMVYKKIPDFHIFIKLTYEDILVDLKQNIFANIHKTATERYETLLATKPQLFQQISLKYIASFLGMTDSTLSRIRNKK